MRLPDAPGFIAAACKALEGVDIVYLHDDDGLPCAVLLTAKAWSDPWRAKNRVPMELHSHIEPEMAREVPWLMAEGVT